VTVSRAFAGQLERIRVPAGRITVLHNAIDTAWGGRASGSDLRSEMRSRLGIDVAESVVLMVGRLSREKRHDLALEAVRRLKEILPEPKVRLVIVGDGPERALLEQKATSLDLSGSVIFTGHQRDVTSHYAAADVVLISSDTEGSPNALLEAMAAG